MSAKPEIEGERRRIAGLSVRLFGPEDGPPLLMSSGLGGAGGYWMPHLPALAARHRVILYDQRGTGESDRAIPQPYGLGYMADDLLRILDGLSICAAHVVGHAAGGMAALQLALAAPARVKSITVVNGWDAPDPHFVRCMAIRRAIMETQGARAYLTAQPLFLFPADWISAHLDALDRQTDAHAADFQSQDVLFARMDALTGADLRAGLANVRAPVLLVVAEDDMLVPAGRSRALRDALARAPVTLAVSERGGHAVNITRAAWFEETLDAFLATAATKQTS